MQSSEAGSQARTKTSWTPLVVYLVVLAIANYACMPVMQWLESARLSVPILYACAFGLVIGELLFVVILGGLWSRYWLAGILFATFLATVGAACFYAGQWAHRTSMIFGEGGLWIVFLFPTVFLGAGIPFFAGRFWGGWYLTRESRETRVGSDLEAMFLAMTVVAAILFLGRVPQVAWELPSATYWASVFTSILSLSILSAFTVFPLTLLTFRIQNVWRRLLVQGGFILLVMVAFAVFFLVVAFSSANGAAPPVDIFLYLVAYAGTSTIPLLIGLWVLQWTGVRLANFSTGKRDKPTSPLTTEALAASSDDALIKIATNKRRTRYLAISVFGLACIASICVGRIESWRRSTDDRQAELHEKLQSVQGSLSVRNREVVEVKLGRGATDNDLREFLDHKHLETLNLAHSGITDAAVAELSSLISVQKLDLSNTQVTGASIEQLVKMPSLRELSIAGTAMNAEDVLQMVNNMSQLARLDISAMDLTAAELERIASRYGGSIGLRGYGLTDGELRPILKVYAEVQNPIVLPNTTMPAGTGFLSYAGRRVDLSDNPIDGTCLRNVTVPLAELRLDNTALTDASFGPVVKGLSAGRLSLSNTQLTDAILPVLGASIHLQALELGDGKITERGLANGDLRNLRQLALKSRQFDGSCFKDWQPNLYELDMSGSGLNDDTIVYLKKLNGVTQLSLANTELTDASLPILGQLGIPFHLDISDTKITAQGLMRGDLNLFATVRVAFGQYTPAEIRMLKPRMNLVVGSPSEF